jgi:xylulokinase
LSLVGLDVGTSGSKGLLLTTDGRDLGTAQVPYPLSFPRQGWVELDSDTVWAAVQTVISHLARVSQTAGDPIQALAFSVSGDEAVPVDAEGHALYPCMMSMDTRTRHVVRWWEREVGAERVYQATGLRPAENWPLIRLMWLREQEPQIFGRTAQMLAWEELMILRLTGEAVTEHSLASRSMAFDIHTRAWSPEMLALAEIPSSMFPRSEESGVVVGQVSAQAAEALGLPPSTRVVSGGFDQGMAALGAGLSRPGDAVVGTGTWEALTVLTERAALSPALCAGGYTSGCYVNRDLYYCMATNPGGGSVLRWFRDTLGREEMEVSRRTGVDAFELLLRDVPDQPTGMLVLPHFEGSYTPWMDPDSTGAILGLRLSTSREQLIRALLEGVTFELLENVVRLEEAGVTVGTIRATGGGARSPLWLQLKADITGRPVTRVATEEAGCLAAACLAGVGVGAFSTVAQALESFVRLGPTYEPRSTVHEAYRPLFDKYRRLYATLRPLDVGR